MNRLNNCLLNQKKSCLPIWFMRQAGRYLPEFREIRKQNPDFINLCLNSELSSKITLQPLERFDLDAAIIFSDILIVPYALGQKVDFKKKGGPVLSDFNLKHFKEVNENKFNETLSPVYKAISETRKQLKKEKSLICFVGAPWTLIVYMFNLKNNVNLLKNIDFDISFVLEKLIVFLKLHIENQFKAGADIVQIFDSWASMIPLKELDKFCYSPNLKLVEFCKKINLPAICFPRGINKNYLNFLEKVKPHGLNIDYEVDPLWARDNLKNDCLQGGMDPKILLKEEKLIFSEVERYLNIFNNSPYIFNLGHGLLPETNPEMLKKVIEKVKSYRK